MSRLPAIGWGRGNKKGPMSVAVSWSGFRPPWRLNGQNCRVAGKPCASTQQSLDAPRESAVRLSGRNWRHYASCLSLGAWALLQ
jgi:hypothetical protein